MIELLVSQWQQQSAPEVVAFILSIAYVYLAARQNIWCWACAFISTSLYTYVFYSVSLPFHTLLNTYYIVMAVVGFISWNGIQKVRPLKVRSLPLYVNVVLIFVGAAVSGCLYFFAADWFSHEYLFLDITVTVFSILATVLTARKYIDSWIYWLVINCFAIFLFFSINLYLTGLLMFIYAVMSVVGWFEWRRSEKLQFD